MKVLSQILAIFLVGTNTIQIIATLATAVLFFYTLLTKVQGSRSRWIMNRKTKSIENDLWAIE